MKVLFITYHYLSGKGGGVFASRAYINAFAEVFGRLTLLYPIKRDAEPIDISPKVNAIPVWDKRNLLMKGICLLLGKSNRYKDIDDLVGNEHFDVVVFDTCMVTHGVIDYFKKKGSKTITIHHNYQYEYFRDNTQGWLRVPTLFWVKRYEREAVRKSELNLTLTESDKHLLSTHYGNGKEHIEVLGTFEYQHQEHLVYPEINEPRFLITGDLGAVQTENSLLPWMNDYYPLLKEVFPDAKLTLAGKSPSQRLIEKAENLGIEIIPSPESMKPLLAKAKYYICATSLGGGIKLRVMDGLSAGLPVICHEVSARGYEAFIDNGVLLTYNDKSSFRTQLEKLKNHRFNKQLTISLFEQFFSFESGKQRLEQYLTDFLRL